MDSSRTVLDTFPEERKGRTSRPRLSDELLNNRALNSEQCAATFPGLTKDIDDAVAKGPFVLEKSGPLGPLVAQIKSGKVCALATTVLKNIIYPISTDSETPSQYLPP